MDYTLFYRVMNNYQKRYQNTLKQISPAMGNEQFSDKNQIVTFAVAYEEEAMKLAQKATYWYEFQVLGNRKKHKAVDLLIVNHTTHNILLVEAKHISSKKTLDKAAELVECYDRLMKLDVDGRFESVFTNGESIKDYHVYGCFLNDITTESNGQMDFIKVLSDLKNSDPTGLHKYFNMNGLKEPESLLIKPRYRIALREIDNDRYRAAGLSYYLSMILWKIK